MRTFGKMPVDWLMWTVLGYLEDIESNIHQIIWFKNAEFLYFESFVDIGCLCKVYGISIYINLCCHVLINPLASCWENLEIFLWKVLWIKSTAISKLTQNDPLPNRLMRIEPEETMWVHDISIKKNNWPASCVEIACLNHLGLKIISIQRLKHVYQILDIIKVWIIINQPASSKWPLNSLDFLKGSRSLNLKTLKRVAWKNLVLQAGQLINVSILASKSPRSCFCLGIVDIMPEAWIWLKSSTWPRINCETVKNIKKSKSPCSCGRSSPKPGRHFAKKILKEKRLGFFVIYLGAIHLEPAISKDYSQTVWAASKDHPDGCGSSIQKFGWAENFILDWKRSTARHGWPTSCKHGGGLSAQLSSFLAFSGIGAPEKNYFQFTSPSLFWGIGITTSCHAFLENVDDLRCVWVDLWEWQRLLTGSCTDLRRSL